MKKLLFLTLFVFCACAAFANAATADTYYNEGRFANALEEYQNELKNQPSNPYLYYNIGNSYFKLDMTGYALANYQKAFNLNPRDPAIRHNLNLALNKTGQSLVQSGMPAELHQAFYLLSLTELKGLLFAAFWVTGLLFAFYLVKKKGAFTLVFLCVLCAAVLSWYVVRYRIESVPNGVITAPMAELHGGPGANFSVNATIPEGYFVTIKDNKGGWYLAASKTNPEVNGWVIKDSLQLTNFKEK